ncbi:MAG TPA: sugar ABC transporter substrate-binding protein [Pararhizobium sp.]|nr:sugar ABC transporter substrate-binding protein [Pararhizobium sp.]
MKVLRFSHVIAAAGAAALLTIAAQAQATTIAFMRAGPDPFYQYGMKAAEMAAKDLGVDMVTYAANNSSTQELANIQDAITKGVDGILIYAVSLSSERAAIAQANRANVPIFFQYGYDPSLLDKVAGFMQINVNTFGIPVGEYVGKHVPEGEVAIVTGKLGRGDAEAYAKGFREGLKKSGSKAKVVADVPADWNRQKALNATAQILTAHPDLKALYIENDDMAVGASIAIARADKTDQVLLASGTNGAPYGLALIKEGKMALSYANPPSSASVMALRLLLGVIDKKVEPGHYYNAPSKLITKANLDQAEPWNPTPEQVKAWLKKPLAKPVIPAPGQKKN